MGGKEVLNFECSVIKYVAYGAI